ncbi:MAG: hypothetical protein K6C36_02875 [Clostridia bacterium]|nr:hypothetical protein [Clostridia bacterium]
MKNRIFVAILAACLLFLSVGTLAAPKKDYSETENRYLAEFPALSAETVLDGRFTQGVSKWCADHFIFRDLWVSVKTLCDRAALKTSENGVYRARDGSFIDSFDSQEDFYANLASVEKFADGFEGSFRFIIAPNRAQIYPELLPALAPVADSAPLYGAASAAAGYVDTVAPIRERAALDPGAGLYYLTDHHWTDEAAFIAYNAYRESLGLAPRDAGDFSVGTVAEDFYGTTWSRYGLFVRNGGDAISAPELGKMTVTDSKGTVTDSIYHTEALEQKDKYTYFLGGNDGLVTVETGSEGGTLLLVKDSYANCVLPYLCSDYAKIYVVDLRYYKGSVSGLIKDGGVTDALFLYNLKSFCEDKYVRFVNY